MAAKLTRLTWQNSETSAPSGGRELYHLQFSLQAASPETFGYTLVRTDSLLRRVTFRVTLPTMLSAIVGNIFGSPVVE
jgi:hypothetical protein